MLCFLWTAASAAKPWRGLEPGASATADVLLSLGEPSKRTPDKAGELWVYQKDTVVPGTTQTQIRFDTQRLIQRIDVFPAVKLVIADIERTYGGECKGKALAKDCHVRQGGSGGKRLAFNYVQLGLVVFFNEQSEVQSMVFLPEKPAP